MIYNGDFLAEADMRRNEVTQVKPYRPRAESIPRRSLSWAHRRLMARLGGLLVEWGSQLEARYIVEGKSGVCAA
jgi:hypothetical protein